MLCCTLIACRVQVRFINYRRYLANYFTRTEGNQDAGPQIAVCMLAKKVYQSPVIVWERQALGKLLTQAVGQGAV